VIKAVSGQYKGGMEVLTIHAQDVIDVDPVSFSTQSPPRIAFDFVGYGSAVERSAIQLGLRNAKSAVVVQANGRTRVIVNLQNTAPYMISRTGTSFEVQLADVVTDAGGKQAAVACNSVLICCGEHRQGH
jgi:type IV pilus assembly protein PilQ